MPTGPELRRIFSAPAIGSNRIQARPSDGPQGLLRLRTASRRLTLGTRLAAFLLGLLRLLDRFVGMLMASFAFLLTTKRQLPIAIQAISSDM
jgi:hypothetical protein